MLVERGSFRNLRRRHSRSISRRQTRSVRKERKLKLPEKWRKSQLLILLTILVVIGGILDHPLYLRRQWIRWIQRKPDRIKPPMVDIPEIFQWDSLVDFFILIPVQVSCAMAFDGS